MPLQNVEHFLRARVCVRVCVCVCVCAGIVTMALQGEQDEMMARMKDWQPDMNRQPVVAEDTDAALSGELIHIIGEIVLGAAIHPKWMKSYVRCVLGCARVRSRVAPPRVVSRFVENHVIGRAMGTFLTQQDSVYVREFVMQARQREVRDAESAHAMEETVHEAASDGRPLSI